MTTIQQDITRARARLLRLHYESGVGHVGGNLSCIDLLVVLHQRIMNFAQDDFILSKGHAAGAYYTTLWLQDKISEEQLKTFHQEGTILAGHPPASMPGVGVRATGSLGHGLPIACGLALAKKLRNEPGRIYVLMSDGEWQEGSNWEALIFASYHKLPVSIIIDVNDMQGFGSTFKVANGCHALLQRLKSFVPCLTEVLGHKPKYIEQRLLGPETQGLRLHFAWTHKGNGVASMQDRFESHYDPLTTEQYNEALAHLYGDDNVIGEAVQ